MDYTNQLRAEGKSVVDAIKQATEVRFIPIVLTTTTTIGGLLPLTLGGGSLWAPMGWTIIGGLIAATFLSLMVVPVLYKLFVKNGEVAVLFPVAGSPLFRNKDLKNLVNLRASFFDEASLLTRYMYKDSGARKFAFFYEDDVFGKGSLAGAREIKKELNKGAWVDNNISSR